MLESIDCMHWEWKNCPVLWQGQYGRADKKYPTIMLEVVASQDLWIWHAFYGIAGANNDINVLDNSPLFDDLLDDLAPVVPYVVNEVEYRNGYYLADGIYPEWASFVKSFTVATDPKHTYFNQRQESAGKNVEHAFGVLQGRWILIQQPARAYEVNTLCRIMWFYENKEVSDVIWCYDKGSGVGVMLYGADVTAKFWCYRVGLVNLSVTDCGDDDPDLKVEMEKHLVDLLSEELKLQKTVGEEHIRHMNITFGEARRVASQYQKEAEKCDTATETCEQAREQAEALMRQEKR
uniref:Protein ALP1-like n=1 Tax=Tanacetum cinerariifolium TaxID=118510 RepID=A0A6L2N8K0_TANCI|nr:protein ALP1-like [Tanacetum cinerariifolium]